MYIVFKTVFLLQKEFEFCNLDQNAIFVKFLSKHNNCRCCPKKSFNTSFFSLINLCCNWNVWIPKCFYYYIPWREWKTFILVLNNVITSNFPALVFQSMEFCYQLLVSWSEYAFWCTADVLSTSNVGQNAT